MALAFHPELDEDHRVHEKFLRMCGKNKFGLVQDERSGRADSTGQTAAGNANLS